MKNIFYAILAIVFLYVQNGTTEETDAKLTSEQDDHALSRVRRGGLSMMRLGRGLHMLRLGKRSLPFVRLGRSDLLDGVDSDELDRIIYELLFRYNQDFNDRQIPMPRYGRKRDGSDGNEDEGYEYVPTSGLSPPPRLGRFKRSTPDSDMEKRAVPVPRFGRYLEEIRAVPIPRFGRYLYDYDGLAKRNLGMMRLGRAGLTTLRLGRRALPMMRLGKRPLNTLRLGKREDDSQTEVDKRLLNVLRLGKREIAEEQSSEKVADKAE